MRVVRGTSSDVERDRRITRGLLRITERTSEPTLRVWTPPRQVAFGRRDSTADGYQHARRIASDYGYEPIERSVGGRAVAYTGTTVAFALAVPTEPGRNSLERRYEQTTAKLIRALESAGASVACGEPDRSFCPGGHSVRGDGKIAGLAQRVRSESALVGGCVIVSRADEREIANVLEAVYEALEEPLEPSSVGSVEAAGGTADASGTIAAIETAFTAGRETTPVPAEKTLYDGTPESGNRSF